MTLTPTWMYSDVDICRGIVPSWTPHLQGHCRGLASWLSPLLFTVSESCCASLRRRIRAIRRNSCSFESKVQTAPHWHISPLTQENSLPLATPGASEWEL